MKTEVKKTDNDCQVSLSVTLDAEEAKTCVKEVEKVFVREARIDGFRQGKVPIELIRKHFGEQMKAEFTRSMFGRFFRDAVAQEKLDAVDANRVESADCTAEGGSFTVLVDVRPKFKLPTYKGLKVAAMNTAVEDSAIAEQIERQRIGFAKYEDAKEGETVGEGDFVQIDYNGTVGGKPILELAPEAKIVASATGFWTRVDEGQFLPEILEAVKGMKVGESKTKVAAKFDKNAAPEGLKGKKALYDVTVKAFRRRILPDDAELVKLMKFESMDKLTADIRERMEKQAVEQETQRRENEAVELLLKKVNFDVPPSVVDNVTDNFLNEFAQRAQYAGVGAEYIEQHKDEIMKDAADKAVKQVRLMYVIDAIAEAEKIPADDKEKGKKVIELVLANSKG